MAKQTTCACGARILIVRAAEGQQRIPPLDARRDDLGGVAVSFADPVAGRVLSAGQPVPTALEHRYAVHRCAEVAD